MVSEVWEMKQPTRATSDRRTAVIGETSACASQAEQDPRVVAAMQEYLDALDAGQRPDRREFLARHCEIAGDLSACLQGLAFLNSAAAQLTLDSQPSSSAEGPDAQIALASDE